MPSAWKQHVDRWSNCQQCELCTKRNKIVLCRGDLPCDMLFVGEAPGPSENVSGIPFDGPAGKKLDQIVREARQASGWNGRVAFTNLVACIPLDDENKKFAEPDKEHIAACKERLQEIIGIARPRVIVRVGALATKNLASWQTEFPAIDIVHPAAILRAQIAKRDFAIRKAIVTLANAMEGLNVGTK